MASRRPALSGVFVPQVGKFDTQTSIRIKGHSRSFMGSLPNRCDTWQTCRCVPSTSGTWAWLRPVAHEVTKSERAVGDLHSNLHRNEPHKGEVVLKAAADVLPP